MLRVEVQRSRVRRKHLSVQTNRKHVPVSGTVCWGSQFRKNDNKQGVGPRTAVWKEWIWEADSSHDVFFDILEADQEPDMAYLLFAQFPSELWC